MAEYSPDTMYYGNHRGHSGGRQSSDSSGSRRQRRRPEESVDEWSAPASRDAEQDRLDRLAELAEDVSALLDKIAFDLDLNQIFQGDPIDPEPIEAT
jgi:hypothetical protein